MTDDTREQLIKAVRRYLDHHFPVTDVEEAHDSLTGSLLFHLYAGDIHYRLRLTETFLEGEQGTEVPTQQLRDWHVAELLLDAKARIVTVDTTGARIEPPAPE